MSSFTRGRTDQVSTPHLAISRPKRERHPIRQSPIRSKITANIFLIQTTLRSNEIIFLSSRQCRADVVNGRAVQDSTGFSLCVDTASARACRGKNFCGFFATNLLDHADSRLNELTGKFARRHGQIPLEALTRRIILADKA